MYSVIGIICREHAACIFNVFDIPWILHKLLFSHFSFWWESFLIFLVIMIWQFDLIDDLEAFDLC